MIYYNLPQMKDLNIYKPMQLYWQGIYEVIQHTGEHYIRIG